MARNTTPSKTEQNANQQLKKMDIDHDAMATLSNIFRVATKFRTLVEKNVLAEHNLSFSTFTILWIVWVQGPQEFKELAIDCGVSKGTMTGLIKSLTKLNLVSRQQHLTDARRVMITISPSGKKLITGVFPKVNQLETLLTQELATTEKQQMAQLLRIILNTIPKVGSQ